MNLCADPPEESIEKLIKRFEAGEIPLADFNHRLHLMVAVWYVQRMSHDGALQRMRVNLQRLLAHHNVDAYNETATDFWLRFVRYQLHLLAPEQSVHLIVQKILIACGGDSRFIFRYYSKSLLDSPAARAAWCEPDLLSLGFTA